VAPDRSVDPAVSSHAAPAVTGDRQARPARALATVVLRRALVGTDAVALAASIAIALELGDQDGRAGTQLAWALAFVPVLIVVFKLYGLYDRDEKRISHSTLNDVPAVFHALLVGTLGLWVWIKLLAPHHVTLLQGCLLLIIGFAGVVASRAATRAVVRRVVSPERVLVVGSGPAADVLLRKLQASRNPGLELVGYLAGEDEPAPTLASRLRKLGGYADLEPVCRVQCIERVIMAAPAFADDQLTDMIRRAGDSDVKVSVLPTVAGALGPNTELDDVEGVVVLGVNRPRLSRSSWALKRVLDVTVASVLLLFLLPFLPVVALAIKLDSRGPVFFAHERLGRRGRRIKMWKLRTMVEDAEQRVDELRAQSAHDAWLLLPDDPRVTRVGRFLRSWSIDELPQLWNVVRGEMSLVGPRPMPPDIDRHISGWGRRRLDLTPGITGLWQVLGRTSIPFEEMIELDYLYVTNWSVWGDIRLLLRTVGAVLSRRGAN
jgi:exopolysaccharide biosynthesis polyprenyl glycosylphosphotransferase